MSRPDPDLARAMLVADEELRRTMHDVFAAFGQIAQALVETGAAPPPLLTVEEVAGWLHMSGRGARLLVEFDRIPAVKVGRRWMILRDLWLEQLEDEYRRRRRSK